MDSMHDQGDVISATTRRVMGNLKMRHLRLLANMQRYGSLTKVAGIMGISQPAVTKMLAEVEDLFGAPLFVRAGRGLTPTRMGEVAMLKTGHIIQEFDHLAAEMEAVRNGRAARLTIGAAPYVANSLLTRVVTRLHQEHNILSVIRQASSDQLVQALQNHELDCVLARLSAVAGQPNLTHEILYPQRPVLVGHESLIKRLRGRRLEWQQLARMNWILPSFSTPVGRRVAELFAYMQVPAPTPVIETYSTEVMYGVISQNESIVSVVPQTIADDMARRGGVAVVPWELDWELPPLTLIRRTRNAPLVAEETFVTVVRELCADGG